jgi:hypothetical protein
MSEAAVFSIDLPYDERRWVGTIKFFDQRRRWGFIVADPGQHDAMPSGARDIFMPWTSLVESGIPESRVRLPGGRCSFLLSAPDGPGRNWKAVQLSLIKIERPALVAKARF